MKLKKVNFDKFVNIYDKLLEEKTKFFSEHNYFAKIKVHLALRNLELSGFKRINILEFGCGTGRNIKYLKKYFANYNATIEVCDISKKSLKYVRNLHPKIRYFSCKEPNYYFDYLEKYDIIFIAGVYHLININDRLSATINILRMLKKNGQVIIFEHNPLNFITRKIVNSCEYDDDAILLRPSELINYYKKLDLILLKKRYYLLIPPKLFFLRFLEYFFSSIPLGGQYFLIFKKT
jgi:SAM-dependent methyltransferase